MTARVIVGDCLEQLRLLPSESVQCCVTSPPYWRQRDYGMAGQLGLEASPEEYIDKIVAIFAEVRRVLADDGTLWLNLGDSYATAPKGPNGDSTSGLTPSGVAHQRIKSPTKQSTNSAGDFDGPNRRSFGLASKNLIGVPWRVAFALQADDWYLRSDIIWSKKNCMPESVTDRPTKSHEYLFLLAKSERYYYDAAAIAEPVSDVTLADRPNDGRRVERSYPGQANRGNGRLGDGDTRNRRTVWTVSTSPFLGAHFATFPPALIEPCILAGCAVDGTVLDPFGGAGTTGLVANRLGRHSILIELNPEYATMAEHRIYDDNPLFNGAAS